MAQSCSSNIKNPFGLLQRSVSSSSVLHEGHRPRPWNGRDSSKLQPNAEPKGRCFPPRKLVPPNSEVPRIREELTGRLGQRKDPTHRGEAKCRNFWFVRSTASASALLLTSEVACQWRVAEKYAPTGRLAPHPNSSNDSASCDINLARTTWMTSDSNCDAVAWWWRFNAGCSTPLSG